MATFVAWCRKVPAIRLSDQSAGFAIITVEGHKRFNELTIHPLGTAPPVCMTQTKERAARRLGLTWSFRLLSRPIE
eukprot:7202627-Pyramimonas_sp.AAC.1